MTASPYTYTYESELLFWVLATLIISATIAAVCFTGCRWRGEPPPKLETAKPTAYNFTLNSDE
jgi:hypothetical protein